MFVWGELKRGVPNSVWFCIGDIPIYIFFIPTHPYLKTGHTLITSYIHIANLNLIHHAIFEILSGKKCDDDTDNVLLLGV